MRLIDADAFEVVFFENKSEEFVEGATCILEMIDEAPTVEAKPAWIPCSDRLPEKDREVLITLFGDVIEIGWIDSIDNIWYTDEYDCDEGTVLAWMPLPTPYNADMRKKVE